VASEPPWEEPEEIARLYAQHATGAKRFAFLLTGDEALAEDLMQDAFVRVGGRLDCLRDPAAFEPYLHKTIRNLVRMNARRRRVERTSLEREGRMRRPEAVAEPDVVGDQTMRRALLALPPRQRAALVLRYHEDLSVRQIAEILGCPPGTVTSLIWRGRRAVLGEIAEDGGEDPGRRDEPDD
jgi:RNA polymerase sigma factor (sigma-70 family)